MMRYLCALVVGLVCASAAEPSVLVVGNEGIDSDTCGYGAERCRSINQAIRNARDGDTIVVEAGIYGDLNRNGILGEAGEEPAPADFGGGTVVRVDKRVTVISERGAAATVIDTGETGFHGVSVIGGAVFGFSGMGFTVLINKLPGAGSGASKGIMGGDAVTIAGNRVFGSSWGIYVNNVEVDAEGAEVIDNEVTGRGPTAPGGAGIRLLKGRIVGNVLRANTHAIETATASVEDNIILDNVSSGVIQVSSGFLLVTGNDVVGNGIGISIREGVIQDNNIIANRGCGLTTGASYLWAAYNYWGGRFPVQVVPILGTSFADVCAPAGAIVVTDPVRLEPDGR
jgi:hypothetical protein